MPGAYDRRNQPFLHGALDLAESGIPVFPLRVKSKIPAIPQKKGGRGMLDATTNPDKIIDWWTADPSFTRRNVAIRTGVVVDVLDLDSDDAFDLIRQLPGYVPINAPRVKTAKGFHFYFAASGLSSKTGFLPKIDFRGRDASATAPPSVHETGWVYRWLDTKFSGPCVDFLADTSAFPALPGFLARAINPPAPDIAIPPRTTRPSLHQPTKDRARSKNYVPAGVDEELRVLREAQPGGRNAALNQAAFNIGQLVNEGHPYEDAFSGLLDVAVNHLVLPGREAEATIKSGLHKGIQTPRSGRRQ